VKRLARILGFFLAICVVVGAVFALVGALVSYFHGDMSYTHAIAWALWLGGCLLIVLVGQLGSTTRMAGESRIVVGGRLVLGSDIPRPRAMRKRDRRRASARGDLRLTPTRSRVFNQIVLQRRFDGDR
jgi:hypothetical protein